MKSDYHSKILEAETLPEGMESSQNHRPIESPSLLTPTKGKAATTQTITVAAKAEPISVKFSSEKEKDAAVMVKLKDRWIALAGMFIFSPFKFLSDNSQLLSCSVR